MSTTRDSGTLDLVVGSIVKVLVALVALAALAGTGLLLWSARNVFSILGLAAMGIYAAVFLVHCVRALRGHLTLPFFTVMIIAGVPALVIARSVGPSPFLQFMTWSAMAIAVLGIVVYVRGIVERRHPHNTVALALLALSVLAVLMSWQNQSRVHQLHMDIGKMLEEEQEDARAIAEAEKIKMERMGVTGGPMTATMSEEESLDLGGMSTAEAQAYREKLKRAAEARRRMEKRKASVDHGYGGLGDDFGGDDEEGKRTEGEEGAEGEAYGEMTEDASYKEELAVAYQRWTPDEKMQAANYADHLAVAVKYVLLVTALMVAFGYFQQLNRTDCATHPLPLTGRWLDEVCPKEHVIWFDTDDRRAVAAYLRRAVLKGESFVHLGDEPPFQSGRLPRWDALGIVIVALGLVALCVIGFLAVLDLEIPNVFGVALVGVSALLVALAAFGSGFRQEHLRDDESEFFANSSFVFESAWFGRLSFSIRTPEVAERFLADFREAVELRQSSRAVSRQTLNIVWDYDEDPPEEAFVKLCAVARRENLRVIIVGRTKPLPEIDDHVEAIYDERDLL